MTNRKIYSITLNDSMIKIYKAQHEKILEIVDQLFDKIGYEKQPEVIELFDLDYANRKEMLKKKAGYPAFFFCFIKRSFLVEYRCRFLEAFMKKNKLCKRCIGCFIRKLYGSNISCFFVLPTIHNRRRRCCRGIKTIITICTIVWLINILMIGLYVVGIFGKAFALKSLVFNLFSWFIFVSLLTYVTTFPKDTFVGVQPCWKSIYCGLISGDWLRSMLLGVNASTGVWIFQPC